MCVVFSVVTIQCSKCVLFFFFFCIRYVQWNDCIYYYVGRHIVLYFIRMKVGDFFIVMQIGICIFRNVAMCIWE